MFVLLICLPVGALAASTVQGTVSELPKSLAQQGWQYQSDAEGNVYYYPPQPLSTADEGKEAAVSDVAQQDISRLLLERGWMLETNAQGDTLLRPIRPPTPPDIHELLQTGTPDQVRDYTKKTIDELGQDGGFIMSTGVGEMEGSDLELVGVWADATREFGVY